MTQTMTASAARKASKKTQHVRSTGDWITLIVLIAAALLVLFPLLVLTVNAFKTPADYNATGPLSLPKPDSLIPPNGMSLAEMTKLFTPTIPLSMPSATRLMRRPFSVKAKAARP